MKKFPNIQTGTLTEKIAEKIRQLLHRGVIDIPEILYTDYKHTNLDYYMFVDIVAFKDHKTFDFFYKHHPNLDPFIFRDDGVLGSCVEFKPVYDYIMKKPKLSMERVFNICKETFWSGHKPDPEVIELVKKFNTTELNLLLHKYHMWEYYFDYPTYCKNPKNAINAKFT